MKLLYTVDVMARGAPQMTLSTLERLSSALDQFTAHWAAAYNDDNRVKLHHMRDHLAHAAGWWPRAFATVEQQEAANSFLRNVYASSNHINPALTVAKAAASRIEARLLCLCLGVLGASKRERLCEARVQRETKFSLTVPQSNASMPWSNYLFNFATFVLLSLSLSPPPFSADRQAMQAQLLNCSSCTLAHGD